MALSVSFNTITRKCRSRSVFLLSFLLIFGYCIFNIGKDTSTLKAFSEYAYSTVPSDVQYLTARGTDFDNNQNGRSSGGTGSNTHTNSSPVENYDKSTSMASPRSESSSVNISRSGTPLKMKFNYHGLWSHTTNTISIPEENKYPLGKRRKTSLEILESVLNGEEHQQEFLVLDDYITGKSDIAPKCMQPDIAATQKLANEIVKVRYQRRNQGRRMRSTMQNADNSSSIIGDQLSLGHPILNVGYPKSGTTTLHDYLNCIGLRSSHAQNGREMFKQAKHGETLFKRDIQAYCQLDSNFGPGYYPQISLLDELHEEQPHSTFVMIFRPFQDWLDSIKKWRYMRYRFESFVVPGLKSGMKEKKDFIKCKKANMAYKTKNVTQRQLRQSGTCKYIDNNRHNKSSSTATIGDDDANTVYRWKGLTDYDIAKWWCGHVNHMREYVKEYPSHKLIELDLYNTNGTSKILYDLFQGDDSDKTTTSSSSSCWGKSNASTKKTYEKMKRLKKIYKKKSKKTKMRTNL